MALFFEFLEQRRDFPDFAVFFPQGERAVPELQALFTVLPNAVAVEIAGPQLPEDLRVPLV